MTSKEERKYISFLNFASFFLGGGVDFERKTNKEKRKYFWIFELLF